MKASIISLITILSSSILIATPAKSEMIPIVTSQDGTKEYYIDTNSVSFDRNFVEASIEMKSETPSDSGVSSITARWKANCSYRSKMIIAVAYYGTDGKLLGSRLKPSGWGAITPGAIEEDIYHSMCNQFRR